MLSCELSGGECEVSCELSGGECEVRCELSGGDAGCFPVDNGLKSRLKLHSPGDT